MMDVGRKDSQNKEHRYGFAIIYLNEEIHVYITKIKIHVNVPNLGILVIKIINILNKL